MVLSATYICVQSILLPWISVGPAAWVHPPPSSPLLSLRLHSLSFSLFSSLPLSTIFFILPWSWTQQGTFHPHLSSLSVCIIVLPAAACPLPFSFLFGSVLLGLIPDNPPGGNLPDFLHSFCADWTSFLASTWLCHCADPSVYGTMSVLFLHGMWTQTEMSSLFVPMPGRVWAQGWQQYLSVKWIIKINTIMRCKLVGVRWITPAVVFMCLTILGSLAKFI